MPDNPFSHRFEFAPAPEIRVFADAPKPLRQFLIYAGRQQLADFLLYVAVADALNVPVTGTSDAHSRVEAERLVDKAPWYRVYDIIERVRAEIRETYRGPAGAATFETKLNEFFREHGYGWQMVNGRIIARGEEAFEAAVETARTGLEEAGRPTAARRIHEALRDLSRKPQADYAGAISHAVNALECVAGDIAGNNKETLGDLLKVPDLFPASLRKVIEGVWAYANNEGARHGKEGKEPGREEAELIVGLAAMVATYVNRKHR